MSALVTMAHSGSWTQSLTQAAPEATVLQQPIRKVCSSARSFAPCHAAQAPPVKARGRFRAETLYQARRTSLQYSFLLSAACLPMQWIGRQWPRTCVLADVVAPPAFDRSRVGGALWQVQQGFCEVIACPLPASGVLLAQCGRCADEQLDGLHPAVAAQRRGGAAAERGGRYLSG